MVRHGCFGSIHRRRSSIDEARSFFEKVQLHLQLADLFIELVLFGVGLLAHLLAAAAEQIRQAGQGLLLPSANLRRVDAEHLCDLRVVLCARMASTATLAFRLGGWFLRVRGIDSPSFSMPSTI